MKILLIHNFYKVAGGECHAVHAQRRLLQENGHEVITFFRDSKALSSARPLEKLRTAAGVRGNHGAMGDLAHLVQRECPDVAHVHNVFPLISPLVYRVLYSFGIPVVQTVHNLRLRCPGGLMFTHGKVCEECTTSGLKRAVINRCVQGSLAASLLYADAVSHAWRSGYIEQNIDRFIVFNSFFRRQVLATGIPGKRLMTLPNFVPLPFNEVADKQPYALYLGRLSAEKGVDTLLDAWRQVDGLVLKIAGGGDLSSTVEKRCTTDLAGKVEYLGYVEGHEKQDLLRRARVFVLPSEWYENCPIALLESMAAGTAAVVTRMGGLPDMVDDGETGFVVEAGNVRALAQALQRFSDEPDLASDMGTTALLNARAKYGPAAHHAGLMAIYQSVIEQIDPTNSASEATINAGY